MVSFPCQCPGMAGKICNHFLPAEAKDTYRLCVTTAEASLAMLLITVPTVMTGLMNCGNRLVHIMRG